MERLLRLRSAVVAWLGKLSPRERLMVSAAAAAVFVFVAFVVSVRISIGITTRERHIEEKTRFLSLVSKQAEGYRRQQAERQAMETRLKGPPIQLLSYISQQGTSHQIEVGDLRPSNAPGELTGLKEESVEVSLAKVELGKLARFLQALERGQGVVQVRRLRLTTRNDDQRVVDATFTVSTYQPKAPSTP